MLKRGKLTDEVWKQIAPLLPENGRRGKQWKGHRKVVNGILWKIRTEAPWRDLPERYGPWQTCYDRFSRWRRERDMGSAALAHAQTKSDAVGRSNGRLAWTAPSPALTSTPPGHDVPRAEKTQTGDLSPARGGSRAKPRGPEHQAAPRLRRERPPALGRTHPWSASRKHAASASARRHQGASSRGSGPTAQETRVPHRRPGVQLPELPEVAAETWHPAHDPRAARPA